jgi:hypothetical protein
LSAEIIGHCSGKLVRIGEARGWKHAPRVVNLDA